MNTFIALVKADAVKAEICSVPSDSEAAASHWDKKPGSELYVGIYHKDDATAREMAAKKMHTDPKNIRLIQLVQNPY